MFKLIKKSDGAEVLFETEEGALKTLKAFPNKYALTKQDNTESNPVDPVEDVESIIEE